MSLEDIVASYGMLAVILYGVLGGADFGGGIWDLFAFGPRQQQQRQTIARAMGPVWEANHVWLIFIIVVLFAAFPKAFAALSIALFVPFHLVLVGVTLRGAAFVFRGPKTGSPDTLAWSYIFGVASVMTPFLLGMCMGAVSTGDLRWIEGNVQVTGSPPWLSSVSWVLGGFALSLCAYMAAVFLTNETRGALREDFRKRAFLAGTAVVGFSVLSLPVIYTDAPHLWEGFWQLRTLPVLVVGFGATLLSGWALLKRQFSLARIAAVVQVSLLLLGWGLAHYPYVVYPDLTLANATTEEPTLLFLAITVPFGLMVLVPSLWFLFHVFKGEVSPVEKN